MPIRLGDDQALVSELAYAIAIHGSRAMLLDADNQNAGWASIRQAAASGQAFAVRVAADVLAIDCDDPEQVPSIQAIALELESRGFRPVLVRSGRPEHMHLFSRNSALLKDHVRGLGLATREVIRPPLSPHREGWPVALVTPSSPQEALSFLRRPGKPTRLPPHIYRLLRDGRPRGERSDAIARVALSMVDRGRTVDDFIRWLSDPRNGLSEKVLEKPDRQRLPYLIAQWRSAEDKARRDPPLHGPEDVLDIIERCRSRAVAERWPGRSGARNQKAYLGLLRIAKEQSSLESRLSERRGADASGMGRKPFRAAMKELDGTLIRRLPGFDCFGST